MYFLYSLGGVTFNKCWITLSILNCYSPNFQGFILMKNALNNQVGMLGDMFLWLVANLKQGVIYFIKQACGNDILASVYLSRQFFWYFCITKLSKTYNLCQKCYFFHGTIMGTYFEMLLLFYLLCVLYQKSILISSKYLRCHPPL